MTFKSDDQNYKNGSGTCLVKFTTTIKVTGVVKGLQKYDGQNAGMTEDQIITQTISTNDLSIGISVKNWNGGTNNDSVYIRKIVAEFNGKKIEAEADEQQIFNGDIGVLRGMSGTEFAIWFNEVPTSNIRITILVCSKQYFTSLKTTKNAKLKARIMEPETELSTETITESQTSSQDTESSEPESTTSNPSVPETTMTESPTTETPATETQTPETELPQTQAPETNPPETSEPETTAPVPQTEQPASETAAPQPETPAPQAETSAPETSAPQKETSAPPQPVEPQTADTQAAEHAEAEQDSGNP